MFEFQPLRDVCKRVLTLDRVEALIYILNKPEVQDEIIRLNQEDQLVKQNVFSDGTSTPEYSKYYKQIKASFTSNVTDRMNFRLTGDFFSTFDIEVLSNGDINIVADGKKDDKDLFTIYGIEILGLTEESKSKLTPLFEEFLLEYVSNKLQGV